VKCEVTPALQLPPLQAKVASLVVPFRFCALLVVDYMRNKRPFLLSVTAFFYLHNIYPFGSFEGVLPDYQEFAVHEIERLICAPVPTAP
jgi:hypothetical protein